MSPPLIVVALCNLVASLGSTLHLPCYVGSWAPGHICRQRIKQNHVPFGILSALRQDWSLHFQACMSKANDPHLAIWLMPAQEQKLEAIVEGKEGGCKCVLKEDREEKGINGQRGGDGCMLIFLIVHICSM